MVIREFSQEMGIKKRKRRTSRAVSNLLYIIETEAETRGSCLGGAILHSCILFTVCLLYIVCMWDWRFLFRPAYNGAAVRHGMEA